MKWKKVSMILLLIFVIFQYSVVYAASNKNDQDREVIVDEIIKAFSESDANKVIELSDKIMFEYDVQYLNNPTKNQLEYYQFNETKKKKLRNEFAEYFTLRLMRGLSYRYIGTDQLARSELIKGLYPINSDFYGDEWRYKDISDEKIWKDTMEVFNIHQETAKYLGPERIKYLTLAIEHVLAWDYFRYNKFAEAIAKYKSIIVRETDEKQKAFAYSNLSLVLYFTNQTMEGLENAREAYRISNDTIYQPLVGLGYFYLGQYKEAIDQCQSALRNYPEHLFGNIITALILEEQKKIEESIPYYFKYIKTDPSGVYAKGFFNIDINEKMKILSKKYPKIIAELLESSKAHPPTQDGGVELDRSEDISKNIPQTEEANGDAIAVIIGNKDYQRTKPVSYAVNDAELMKEYVIKAFGFKPGNVFFVKNATKSDFESLFGVKGNYKGKVYNAVKAEVSDLFIFYSGHGAPDIKSQKGYLMPVEADPQYVDLNGYSLELMYENVTQIPAKTVTIVMDACFSGADLLENVSPMVVKVDNPVEILNKGVILTSSRDDQVSSWYNEKRHGLFTYFFLKAIHDKNADRNGDNALTVKEVYDFIADKTEGIPYYARRLHGVEQDPFMQTSDVNRILVAF